MDATVETLTDLAALKELLSDPDRWTQGAMARDIDGYEVRPSNPRACRFCLVGAMWRIVGSESLARYHRLRDAFTYKDSLTYANDKMPHSEVLSMIETDLAALRQKVDR